MWKRMTIGIALTLAAAIPAAGQTPTVVSGQIKDTNGVAYSFAQVAAQLVTSSTATSVTQNDVFVFTAVGF